MRKKRIIIGSILLAIVMVSSFSLRKCENIQIEDEVKTIAISTIGATHTWPIGVAYYAELEIKRVADENGWNYRMLIADNTNEQSDQIIELVHDEVDCIVLLPMDGVSLKTAVMSVQEADIPLVVFDREIPDIMPAATVKGDNTKIGKITADILNGMYPDGTCVLEVMGDTSTVPQQRTDGFNEMIHDNFVVEQVGYTEWNREQASRIMKEWIKKQTKEELEQVQAIFAHDDEISLGILDVIDEYKEAGKGEIFPNLEVIIGSAGAKELYARITKDDTYMISSLTYSPEMIVEAIRVGEKIMKGEDYEEMTIIEPEEVNYKNIEQYYDENSFY